MSSDLESESGSPLLLLLQTGVPSFLMSLVYGQAKVTGNWAVSKNSSKYPLLNPKSQRRPLSPENLWLRRKQSY